MSGWTANFADTKRQKALRLLVLRGEERRLHHQRDLWRRDLGYLLQRSGTAPKSAEAKALEAQIHANMVEWQTIIDEIRELQRGAAA